MKALVISLTIHLGLFLTTFDFSTDKTVELPAQKERVGQEQYIQVVLKLDEQATLESIKRIEEKEKQSLKKHPVKKLRKKIVQQKRPEPRSQKKVTSQRHFEGKEVKNKYISELKSFIENQKYYPRQAVRLRHSGVVEIALLIDQEGNFKKVQIKKTSTFSTLNNAAMELIKRLNKFKPLPEELKGNIVFNIPLNYSL